MTVSKEQFLKDVAALREKRKIVLDKEIIDNTGVAAGNLSSYLSGRIPPSKNFLEKFYSHYGKFLKQDFSNASAIDLGDSIIINVPLVPQHAHAGYLSGFADPEYIENLATVPFIVDKEPKGKYIAIEVRGESMNDGTSDSYLPGDVLLCREVKRELWQSKLHIKKWDFVIVHRTKGIVFKRIADHNTGNGHLKLHSLNPEYEDFTVKMDDILQLCNVVQVMRKK